MKIPCGGGSSVLSPLGCSAVAGSSLDLAGGRLARVGSFGVLVALVLSQPASCGSGPTNCFVFKRFVVEGSVVPHKDFSLFFQVFCCN